METTEQQRKREKEKTINNVEDVWKSGSGSGREITWLYLALVRAAGLEPNPKGEKISTEDLLADWKRVAEKLGRRPSRAEYVREGKYSAGALTIRFGSWSAIGENPLTTKDTKEHKGGKSEKSKTRERSRRADPG